MIINFKIKNTLINGSLIYLLANIINSLIPFILLPILTRTLSTSEYGEVAMFQLLISALSAFAGLSIDGAANRKFYDICNDEKEFSYYIAACLQLLLCSFVVTFFAVFLFRGFLSDILVISQKWILYAVILSAASVIIQLRLGQWQVRNLAKRYGALQILQSVFNLIFSLVAVVVLHHGADGRINALIWTTLVFALISIYFFKRESLLNFFIWRPIYIKEAINYGVPLIPHVTGIFLLWYVDRLVISKEFGLAETGIYVVAVQLSTALWLIFDAVNKAYVPWLYERLTRDILKEKSQIVCATYFWYAAILICVSLVFFVGPYLVSLVAGDKYAPAGEIIGWLALGQGFSGMYLMVASYIFFSKKTGLLSFVTIISGILYVILLVFLVRLFGIHGAAIAFSISMGVRFFLTWYVAQKLHPMPWSTFYANLRNDYVK